MMDVAGLIQLPQFRFPEHHLIQEWLSGTEYGERYYLVLLERKVDANGGWHNNLKLITTPALEPIKGEEQFLLTLQGDATIKELSVKYHQEILDFHKK